MLLKVCLDILVLLINMLRWLWVDEMWDIVVVMEVFEVMFRMRGLMDRF